MGGRMPKVAVDLRPYFKGEERGSYKKDLIVLHETVSHNRPGTADIKGVAAFMDKTGLEIHGIIDMEGNAGWCYQPTAVYDHAASGPGKVNSRGIGFELVSEIPFETSNKKRREQWASVFRRKQLDTTAAWVAYLSRAQHIPLKYSDGRWPGITTHWDVSQSFLGGDGHWDCWPKHKGGYFPVLYVVYKARQIRRLWDDEDDW